MAAVAGVATDGWGALTVVRECAGVDPMPWVAAEVVPWRTAHEACRVGAAAAAAAFRAQGAPRERCMVGIDRLLVSSAGWVTWAVGDVRGSAPVVELVRWAAAQLTPADVVALDDLRRRMDELRIGERPGELDAAADGLVVAAYARAATDAQETAARTGTAGLAAGVVQLPLWEP